MIGQGKNRHNGIGLVNGLVVFAFGITAVAAFIALLTIPLSQSGCGCIDAEEYAFPTINIILTDSPEGNEVTIRHLAGDPLDLYNYKILIEDIESGETTVLGDLYDEITAGETLVLKESETMGLDRIDFEKGREYRVEIYYISDNRLVFEKDVICE